MSEEEAKKLCKKGKSYATKSLTRWKPDWDSAAVEYDKAANIYSHIGKFQEAKEAWTLSAEAHYNAGNVYLAGKNMDQLAQLLKDQKDVKGSAASYAQAAKYYLEDNKPDRQSEALQRAARTIMPTEPMQGAKYLDEGLTALETSNKYHLAGDLYPLLLQCYLKNNCIPEALATIKRQFVALKALNQDKGIARGVLEIIVIVLGTGDEVLARREFEAAETEHPAFMRNEEWALAADLLAAVERRDDARLKEIQKDQTFSFLNVEVSRIAKRIKVGSGPAIARTGGEGSPTHAEAPPEDDER
jgi:tetratricopeptide (TPR) repeat protein